MDGSVNRFAIIIRAFLALACAAALAAGTCASANAAFADSSEAASASSSASSASASSDNATSESASSTGASSDSSSSSSTSSANSENAASGEPTIAEDPFEDAVSVDLDDGVYLIDIKLEGGSGKASLSSPAEFEVFGGVGVVTAEWSSQYYDYMLVNGKKYLPVNESGDSVFIIPVMAYDEPFDVVGDTTAMSEAHEVDYQITVKLDSVQPYDTSMIGANSESELDPMWIVFIVCIVLAAAALGVTVFILVRYHQQRTTTP